MSTTVTVNGTKHGPLLILAHGAGADSNSDFMQQMAEMIAEHGVQVWRFDFPYMIKRQSDGKKRPPDRADKLLQAFLELVEQAARPCMVGGKSMGGRMASMLAQQSTQQDWIRGSVALGYPFHPPGKPEKQRTEHLQSLQKPQLIIQGERDAMGNREEVEQYDLDPQLELFWLADGNHDLKPRKVSGHTHQAHMQQCAEQAALFVQRLLAE
ncbi:alpha/beta hydrolase [Bacterioplanes sanyensis]|uniref:Alpha/beta hydrolase n=1 Tax=Bacterioplanes sanyensis TaxID=1249553 RepID=A0A222FMN7_9GAMM|nr:alpha/beta fold hydrolase [Bacterioplanes sanyensis]ASP40288.1 alpha/beta hydrolase [Bacterioplanes sanyensis]